MADLFINPDDAAPQAQAVLAYLRQIDHIECSWNEAKSRYEARPEVDRWHNCREQGYVVQLKARDYSRQVNIAFFEHRNSDRIHAVKWEGGYINPPTIDNVPTSHPYAASKWDTDFSVDYGRPAEMADWIRRCLESFWGETSNVEEGEG